MSDPYEGVTTPDPERDRLARSVFHPSSLEEVAEAVSAATEKFHDIYVERRGDQYRWSFATKGGPYPLLRITARFLRMDPYSLRGVGSRVVGDGWCAQIVDEDETGTEPYASVVLRFDERTTVDQVALRVRTGLQEDRLRLESDERA
ncbi:MAG: hypothetical protein ACLQU9_13410 [Acidimicrobiales bacterium]